MKRLDIAIEIMGRHKEVGSITGDSDFNAEFRYSDDYLNSPEAVPLSLSLPLTDEPYGPEPTRNFFEGLLPEGFLRRAVAKNNRVDADDYLTLLEMLGAECLGAISVKGTNYEWTEPEYRELDADLMYRLAAEGATKSADLVVEAHLSLTGASGKVGVYCGPEGKWFLPVGSAPSTHILKQSHIRYDHIVQNEQLCLMTAKAMGIKVPESTIIESEAAESDDAVLLATERYDRILEGSVAEISGLPCPLRLHQEDFAQAMGISSANKYERQGEHHMHEMFRILRRNSASPIEDQFKLWDIIVFHYLIGNTDGHIKNFSLLYDPNLKGIRLAPAYDIVSTIVYDSHSTQMAFSIGGESEWSRLDRSCFERAADEAGLNRRLFMNRFDDMAARFKDVLTQTAASMTAEGHTEAEAMAAKIINSHERGRTWNSKK
ncbi:MAG: type II toxin-antitoxin system HipA family toxin [Mogibacterium sp.]|nr:type II toxin-antitoxin system HipA family toxin [Mogibacterium sp.]